MFITLEGIEASGKSTQAKHLKAWLEQQYGRDVILTREPGGTPAAEAIRTVLLQQGNMLPPVAQGMLANAARMAHVQHVIAPALASGKIVVCDRYTDSTLAYQGYAQGNDGQTMAHLRTLNYMATGEILPDVTLILDLPVSTALERLQHRGGADDVFERETVEFWEKLRQGFLDLARQHPVRSRVIDADGSEEEVAARIKAAISRKT